MTLPKVFYLSKKDNLPNYYAGKELHTVEYDRGWIEYLLQTSDVYFLKLNNRLRADYHPTAKLWLETAWFNQDCKHLSLMNQLINIRLEQPFDLPLFTDWRNGRVFSCGNSRFTAEILCGTEPEQIPVFFQVAPGHRPKELETAIPVTSTRQAEQLSNIVDTEYRLAFDQSSQPVVISSILRNTIYEADSNYSTFEENGQFILNFWKKFVSDGRINITVTSNSVSQKLVHFNTAIWNVNFIQADMEGFSFGEILDKFNQPNDGRLNLYVYDITEPFDLCYLLPWTTTNRVWCHTLNKKVNLFDTTRGAATACWPIVAMGNFVK
jgi:hypothetical protein